MPDDVDLPITKGWKHFVGSITTPSNRQGIQRSLITTASSVSAVLIAFTICAVILEVTGKNPVSAYHKMFSTGIKTDKLFESLQRATPLIISAVAVAIGFKMGLFNIGVEGQFAVGALIASVIGAHLDLPAPIHVAVILIIASVGGVVWAGIAALLKVFRGVNEVIATIMLNYVALSVVQWLFDTWFRDDSTSGLNVKTKLIPTSGWMPQVFDRRLSAMFFVAVGVLLTYWILVFKSRFGFRLRASGLNKVAARTAGIPSNRMIVIALLLSGAAAGLVAMHFVLGETHAFRPGIASGLGFNGIAVALLGRNHPLGIAAAAFLFGFLDSTAGALQLQKVPNSIIDVIQAVIVLTVVIVNEAVTRAMNKRTANRTAAALHTSASPIPAGATA